MAVNVPMAMVEDHREGQTTTDVHPEAVADLHTIHPKAMINDAMIQVDRRIVSDAAQTHQAVVAEAMDPRTTMETTITAIPIHSIRGECGLNSQIILTW